MGVSKQGFRRGMAKLMNKGYSKDEAYEKMKKFASYANTRVLYGQKVSYHHKRDAQSYLREI